MAMALGRGGNGAPRRTPPSLPPPKGLPLFEEPGVFDMIVKQPGDLIGWVSIVLLSVAD